MRWLMLKVRMHNALVVTDLHIAGSRVINDRRVT